MAFMVKIGVVRDNYAAIRTATSVAAAINKQSDKLGTLEAGKLADVIVVDGDPVADLDALTRVRMTYVNGRRLV
jgi:imidazolonepropionase-like amidohydrolase